MRNKLKVVMTVIFCLILIFSESLSLFPNNINNIWAHDIVSSEASGVAKENAAAAMSAEEAGADGETDDPLLENSLLSSVVASCNGEARNVLTEVMNVSGGVFEDIQIRVNLNSYDSSLTYKVIQYNAGSGQTYDVVSSDSIEFAIPIEKLYTGIPLYLCIYRSGSCISVNLLMIRIVKGQAEELVPDEIESEYKNTITVSMDELLPGMNFAMHPYILPITAKAYTDGRMVIGLGLNSSNVTFWKNARNGTLKDTTTVKELSDAFWGNSSNRNAVKGKDMGLVVEFSGAVQGNLYSQEPMKGTLTAYVGSGFNVTGQYFILTWEVTVTVGVSGTFEFQLKYNEATSKYSDFQADRFSLQFKTGLELYGGIGLSSIASIGLYGSGSIAGVNTFYPVGTVDSLVLSGECGFKVKLFSRKLFSFAIVSGSHEFVQKQKNSNDLLNVSNVENVDDFLLAGSYAESSGTVDEPDTEGTWYPDRTGLLQSTLDGLQGYETDPDFAHMIAENIYPDNQLQAVAAGGSDPEMQVMLLGTDTSRANGNRSRLMNFYYKEDTNFMSEPSWMFEDDGTADYNPYAYYSDASGRTYIVWQNGMKAFDEKTTFQELSESTDIYFAEHADGAGDVWSTPKRVTYYKNSSTGLFAAGARVSDDQNGDPVITFYTNDITDPAGVNTHSEHIAYITRLVNGAFSTKWIFTVTDASILNLESGMFMGYQSVAVTLAYEENGSKAYRIELWMEVDGQWMKAWERTDAMNASFVPSADGGDTRIVWFENNGLYYRTESGETACATLEELLVPTGDFRIYGTFGAGSSIALVGTELKDGSEDAYAIVSNDGGSTWHKADLTRLEPDSLVSSIAICYTSQGEPVVFYSVSGYENHTSVQDAENLLHASAQQGMYAQLSSDGFMLGQDDPRFTDTQTNLFVKARKANMRVEIEDGYATDEDNAIHGQETPVKLEVKNNGLYDISSLAIFVNGEKREDVQVSLKAGETKDVLTSVVVPPYGDDEPVTYTIGIACRDEIEDTKDVELGLGTLYVEYYHQVLYGREQIAYTVTNHGFASRKVHLWLFDEETGKMFYEYPTIIAPQSSGSSQYSTLEGLFVQQGHEYIRAYILTEDEHVRASARSFNSIEEFEEFLGLDSIRSTSIQGLNEMYAQPYPQLLSAEEESSEAEESSAAQTESAAEEVTSAPEEVTSVPEEVSTAPVVKAAEPAKTGDSTHTAMYLVLAAGAAIISLAALFIMIRRKLLR